MAVPDELRRRLTRWCVARIPPGQRANRQIGFTIRGDEVRILDRHPPTYPELNLAWSATPVALLRLEDAPSGHWVLYRRAAEDWVRVESGPDPITLLDAVRV
jgi:hypothetical protein